jgi:hypothetical protein
MASFEQEWENWQSALQEVLERYQHKVSYGNLRAEKTEWTDAGCRVSNLAIVYEVPGGSTNQINVCFGHDDGNFSYVNPVNHDEVSTRDGNEVLAMVESLIHQIPDARQQRLREDIERWFGEGRSHHEMFNEINKLLQLDFKGGSITHQELKYGINYIIELGKLRLQEA